MYRVGYSQRTEGEQFVRRSIGCLAAVAAIIGVDAWSGNAGATLYTFIAHLTPDQVVPPTTGSTNASGTATVVLNAAPGTTTFPYTMTTDLTWTGLSGPTDKAHVHDAAPGQKTDFNFEHDVLYVVWGDPGLVVPCGWLGSLQPDCAPPSGSSHNVLNVGASNIGEYVDGNFATLLGLFESGDMYVDIHTQAHPEGEIRGQFVAAVLPEPSGIAGFAMAGALAASLGYRRLRRWRPGA